ncbi:hypothetical protein tb265_35860 [Gemmatimonadetes bacterium T265]|nr:hypothetical protein tb265_35860 [Gemmatimonadetes bacterium T265]
MSALAKIKKTAAQHEHDRQYDKALAQYARLLDGGTGSDEEVDVTLYNRAGDLALRAGDVPRAVTYFERAIDLYAAGGFLNNAVALAVKVLRHAPGHLAAHHTLGVLYGRKGFRAEARQHLADYAAQMQRARRDEEVRRTLTELAALGTAHDDVIAVRELLTARAAGPDDAGALVRVFDDVLGPAADDRVATEVDARATPASAALPLSELIEFEVRGPRFAPIAADTAPAIVRWTTALPGDPSPLRVSALGGSIPAPISEFDLVAPEPAGAELRFTSTEVLDSPSFEVSTVDLADPAVDLAHLDIPTFELPAVDDTAFEVPTFVLPAPDHAVVQRPVMPAAELATSMRADDEPTDLGEWLRATEVPSSTRLVTPAPRESGDEQADFDAALHAFTAGIARSVDVGDRESHYDLGVAFREMGLLSDAVREFQRALGAPGSGLREREALAQCFLDLGRPELALVTLEVAASAALASGTASETLVGVHYVLAEAARAVRRTDDARTWYARVLAADYTFRDAARQLAALPPPRASASP